MLGVVEVYNTTSNEISYLAGFAGKLNGQWRQQGWVSPIVVPEQIPAFVQCATKVTNLTNQIKHLEKEIKKENELIHTANNTTTIDTGNDTIITATATATTTTISAATTVIRMTLLQSERKKYATEGLRSLQKTQLVYNFRQQNNSTTIPNAYNSTNISSSTSSSSSSIEKRKKRKDRRKNKKQHRRQLWNDQQQQLFDASVLVDTNKNNRTASTTTTNIHINATMIHMVANSTSTSTSIQQHQNTASHNNTYHRRRIRNMPPIQQRQRHVKTYKTTISSRWGVQHRNYSMPSRSSIMYIGWSKQHQHRQLWNYHYWYPWESLKYLSVLQVACRHRNMMVYSMIPVHNDVNPLWGICYVN